MGTNEISQIEEFHSKEALFENMVKPVWSPPTILEKGSGRLCLINEPPLGVIRDQGAYPLRPKGARSMA